MSKIGNNFITVQRVGKTKFDDHVTVFLGNLPIDVQENDVHEFFADCGSISGVRLVRHSLTGAGKGFGFISFASRDSLVLALEKNEHDFHGRSIRVKKTVNQENDKNSFGKKRSLEGKKKASRHDDHRQGEQQEGSKRRWTSKKEEDSKEVNKKNFSGKETTKEVKKIHDKKKRLKMKKAVKEKKKIRNILLMTRVKSSPS